MFTRSLVFLPAMLIASAVCLNAGTLTLITAPDGSTVIPNFAALGTVGSGISSPASGSGFTISDSENAGFNIIEQGVGWSGNFAYGDALLWNQGNGPDTITFTSDVQDVGFKIQNDFFGDFTAYLDAYDSSNNLLGEVSEVGTSSSAGDNSAMFIGVSSSYANVTKVIISTSNSTLVEIGANDFALGSGSFTESPESPVPEPSTFAMASLMLGGLAILRKKIKV